MTDPLSPEETRRYARHIVLRGVGGEGQQKLKAARVLIVGAGGLGSPAIAYLGAAGFGTMTVVDNDRVSLSNLQRQMIHRTDGVEALKAESAAGFVAALNPHAQVITVAERLTEANAGRLVAGQDVILDGTDNFATRRATAMAAEKAGVPLVHGAVSTFDGQVTVFAPGGPKWRSLYPDDYDEADMPACEVTGILGPVTGVVGTLMAMEAVKLIIGLGTPLIGRMLLYDGREARFDEIALG
jgi:molybdopterin/thiamine biosynthesis adenylyltransferase